MNDMFLMHDTIYNMIESCKSSIELAESEILNYRDVYETDDKFEAAYNREWATVIEQMNFYIKDLEKLLRIENTRLEGEVKDFNKAEIALTECKKIYHFNWGCRYGNK